MIKNHVTVSAFISISQKILLIFMGLFLSACSMTANIAELFSAIQPSQIGVDTIQDVTSDNQNSYTVSGTCLDGTTSFTITFPPPEKVVTCNNGSWSVVLDLSSEAEGPLKLVTDKTDPRTGQKIEIEVMKDTTPPTLTDLVVAAGKAITNQSVIGYVVSGVDIAQVYVTEDSTCETGGTWKSAIATVSVSSGDGNKDFYAKARDAVGNVSACAVSTSVTLDQTAPVVTGLSDDLIVKANKSWTWSCTDLHAPCEFSYIITQSNLIDPISYFSSATAAVQPGGDGYYYLAVQAKDLAGNVSAVRRVQVNLSSSLPSLAIEGGALYIGANNVSLNISNFSDFDVLEISNGAICGVMTSLSSQAVVAWSLAAGDGLKEVSYRFKKSVTSEQTECFSNSITVDTTAPVVAGLSNDAILRTDKTWSWSCTDVTPCSYRYVIDQAASTNPTGTYGALASASLTSGDGTYYIHVQARDQLGNESAVVHVSVVLDNTLPSLSGLSDDLTPVKSKTWSWSCADTHSCQARFVVDQVATTVPTGVYSSTMTATQGSGNGNYYIHVQLKDAAGNESPVQHFQAVLDNTAPVITGLTDDSNPHQSKTFNWECTDSYGPCTFRYLIDQTATSTPSSAYSNTLTATHSSGTGNYYLHVQARDVAGNESLVHISFKLDNTSPSVTLSSVAGAYTKESPIVVAAVFSEAVTGLSEADFTVVNGTAGNLTGSGANYSLEITPAGQGTVSVSLPMNVVIDSAGNGNAASVILSRVFDDVAPTVSLTTALGVSTNVSPLVFTVTFSEAVSTFSSSSLSVTNGTATVTGTGPYTVSVVPTGQGDVSVQVDTSSVQDAAGNANTGSSQSTVLYDSVAPSSVTVTLGAAYTTTTSTPSISWTNSIDSGSGLHRYEVAIGSTSGGQEVASFASVGTATSHTVTGMAFTAGTLYYPSVRARDNAGNTSVVTGTAFRYLVAPTVTTLNPAAGPSAGGTTITLTGTGFHSPMAVSIGANDCTSVTVLSATSLTCVTPAGDGDQTVVVTNQASQSVSVSAGFKYTNVSDDFVLAGGSHNCAITPTNGVKCWGKNDGYSLGDGTTTLRSSPIIPTGLSSGVTQIAMGTGHGCALMIDGSVKCWGALGSASEPWSVAIPTTITGFASGVVSISAGNMFTCAVFNTGIIKCFGSNYSGKLGNGTETDSNTPVTVSGITNAVSVHSGMDSSCAILSTGAVKCWGSNILGQLGDGTTTQRNTPVEIFSAAAGVVAIRSGSMNSCAIFNTGALKCWGTNSAGTVGDGTTTQRLSPTAVLGMGSGVTSVAVGTVNTCAVKSGAAYCWGANDSGSIGDGTTASKLVPTAVTGLGSGVKSISGPKTAPYFRPWTCAYLDNNSVKCWGSNYGQEIMGGNVALGTLGNGSAALTTQTTPASVLNFP